MAYHHITRSSNSSDDDDDDAGIQWSTAKSRPDASSSIRFAPSATRRIVSDDDGRKSTLGNVKPLDRLGETPARLLDGGGGLEFPKRARDFYADSPETLQEAFRPPGAPKLKRRLLDEATTFARLESADARGFANDPIVHFAHLVAGHADVPPDSLLDITTSSSAPLSECVLPSSSDFASPALAALAEARATGRARSAERWLNRPEVNGTVLYRARFIAKVTEAHRSVIKRFPDLFDARLRGNHVATPTLRDLQVSRDFADPFARLVAAGIGYTAFMRGRGGRFVSDASLFRDARDGPLGEFASALYYPNAPKEENRLVYESTSSSAILDRVALGASATLALREAHFGAETLIL